MRRDKMTMTPLQKAKRLIKTRNRYCKHFNESQWVKGFEAGTSDAASGLKFATNALHVTRASYARGYYTGWITTPSKWRKRFDRITAAQDGGGDSDGG